MELASPQSQDERRLRSVHRYCVHAASLVPANLGRQPRCRRALAETSSLRLDNPAPLQMPSPHIASVQVSVAVSFPFNRSNSSSRASISGTSPHDGFQNSRQFGGANNLSYSACVAAVRIQMPQPYRSHTGHLIRCSRVKLYRFGFLTSIQRPPHFA